MRSVPQLVGGSTHLPCGAHCTHIRSEYGFCTTRRPHGPGIAGRAEGAGSVVPAPLPWSMPAPSPSQVPSHSPSGGRRGVPRIPYHSLSTPSFCTTPFGGVPGGPGAAPRLPRASRRCWGLGQSGATLVGPAVGDSGPVESASRCLRCWHVCARCRRNNSNLQVIVRSGSKPILVCDLLTRMLLVACKTRAGVIRACQCSSASQDSSSNPEATSDLQSGKDCLIVFYYTTKVQT